MRFLCLHGRGTNSDIFERQLSPLVSRLSSQHSFGFIDAEFDSPPAPGISDLYPPPYLAWHSQYQPQHIQPVHDYLRSVIEEDGPYDGVIGFSQGAALAASFLLCHEVSKEELGLHDHDPPFKVAIFFNSVMLFSPSKDIGSNVGDDIRKQAERHTHFLRGEAPSRNGPSPKTANDYVYEEIETRKGGEEIWDNIFGFSPSTFLTRLTIPTLHVIGTEDQFAEHSRTLIELCRSEKAQTLFVQCGHEIPRTAASLDECAELFELFTTMASVGGR